VAGSPLYFANGFNFLTNSGYALQLKSETNGVFAGYFRGATTFTALPSTENFGGPAFGHAVPGAHLELQIESVLGPAGGAFLFWENEEGELGTHVTFSVPVGERNGTNRFVLSENDGSADSDPFGHIHGRSFGATLAGLYQVGLRILDTSANGPGGTSLHPPSELFQMYYQAGVTIASIAVEAETVRVGFAAFKGGRYQLESTDSLEGPWEAVGDVVVGKDYLESVPVSARASGFFRLRVEGL
jgi:hypothetical protein